MSHFDDICRKDSGNMAKIILLINDADGLPLPTMNQMIDQAKKRVGRGTLYDANKKKWKKKLADIFKKQLPANYIPPVDPVKISITWGCKSTRTDPDNIAAGIKYIFDGLQDAGVIYNDKWRYTCGGIQHNFKKSAENFVHISIDSNSEIPNKCGQYDSN